MKRKVVVFLIAFLLFAFILSLLIGSVRIPPAEILSVLLGSSENENYRKMIIEVRIPRILMGILVGASLSVSGTIVQAIFRNPMADPYILGVSSGAAAGAVIGMALFPSLLSISLFAFLGGLLAVFTVYEIAKTNGRVPVDTLLLSGIAIGSFLSALTSLLMYLTGNYHNAISWLLGSLRNPSWNDVAVMFFFTLLCSSLAYSLSRELNVMLLGEETAVYVGVDPERLKKSSMVLVALMTSVAVSFTGIIGFVGLVVPHMMRRLVGPDHRVLIPSSLLFGATLMVLSDLLARNLIEAEIPIGVITAMFGAPFFIYLIKRRSF
ncbi:MAG: cobalamin transport system permease protein [Archaeoglobi archaeon]|nr:iron ABC transporter permease [Candidatus Mnemosynella bozhongmuii]MDI3502561.1 cobalamin transport system permease protein [Archaeoglobi archaeon]